MNTISITVEPYLAAWMQNHFGNPIELLKESPESKLVKRLIDKRPDNTPEMPGNVEIRLPYYKEKDPRVYSYLNTSAKEALIESFESLFIHNMWSEIGGLENINCQLSTVIKSWCEKHGIVKPTDGISDIKELQAVESRNQKNLETVRQKYYRLRKKYFKEAGVKLS